MVLDVFQTWHLHRILTLRGCISGTANIFLKSLAQNKAQILVSRTLKVSVVVSMLLDPVPLKTFTGPSRLLDGYDEAPWAGNSQCFQT